MARQAVLLLLDNPITVKVRLVTMALVPMEEVSLDMEHRDIMINRRQPQVAKVMVVSRHMLKVSQLVLQVKAQTQRAPVIKVVTMEHMDLRVMEAAPKQVTAIVSLKTVKVALMEVLVQLEATMEEIRVVAMVTKVVDMVEVVIVAKVVVATVDQVFSLIAFQISEVGHMEIHQEAGLTEVADLTEVEEVIQIVEGIVVGQIETVAVIGRIRMIEEGFSEETEVGVEGEVVQGKEEDLDEAGAIGDVEMIEVILKALIVVVIEILAVVEAGEALTEVIEVEWKVVEVGWKVVDQVRGRKGEDMIGKRRNLLRNLSLK